MKKLIVLLLTILSFFQAHGQSIISVTGNIPSSKTGVSLSHEHLLVDFIGAEKYSHSRWNEEEAFNKILPYLIEVKQAGVKTFFDCTPNYLGRDAKLLVRLSQASEINIVTNTGLYGGSDNKYLPSYAFTETAEELSQRWITEFEKGIDGTSVRPGLIKISVNPGTLTDISKKLITAAALTHKATGLTIASHTGPAIPALEQLDILKQEGVRPNAFIWVHAQNEKQHQNFIVFARLGGWVSLDGVNEENIQWYVEVLTLLKSEQLLHRVLISHDAGWFDPGKPDGGTFRPFTPIFTKLIPALKSTGFTQKEIDQLLIKNPAKAYAVSKRVFKRK
jgi:phosphotriesterase-related protein